MDFLKKIQNKPQEQKLRLIWIVAISIAVLLIIVWVISYRFEKSVPKDTTLFQTLGKGIQDVRDNYKK